MAANHDFIIGEQTADEDIDIDRSELKSFRQVVSEKHNESVNENQSAKTPSLDA